MSIDLTKSAAEMIHEDDSGRNPVLFVVIKQNFDVEKAELTKKAHVFKLPCKHCPRKMIWWSKKGYTGLMEHLKTHVDEETIEKLKEEHARKRRRKSKDILEFMNFEKSDVYNESIANFLLTKNMPLSFLGSEEFKNIRNADDLVSENTMRIYLKRMEHLFIEKIKQEVDLELFCLAFIKSEKLLDEALDKVQLLFRKIKKSKKLTAALRKHRDKDVILPNVTRWSGKFLMMKRYLDIWMFCAQLEDDEVQDLILGERLTRTLRKHVDFLATCDRYTVALQNSKFNLGQGKKVVENLLRDVNNNDCLLKYLEDDADILAEFGAFETGVFKVCWEEEDKLDAAEAEDLSRLEPDPSEEEAKTPPGEPVIAELVAQTRESTSKSSYADVSFIPATSCSVERLFLASASRFLMIREVG
eukprot:augustus_masked-scaffold_49-processed-gene-1.6-mRNA-1 protein AED:1.00 eAED:1.00 QI:0/0/0/0/1/1/2/0/414